MIVDSKPLPEAIQTFWTAEIMNQDAGNLRKGDTVYLEPNGGFEVKDQYSLNYMRGMRRVGHGRTRDEALQNASADIEEWRTSVGAPESEVSSFGRIRRRGTVIQPRVHWCDYLRWSSMGATRFVHREVLRAFVGEPPPDKPHTRHIDGNKQNNRLSNLAWGSPTENARDRTMHGTATKGGRHANKLTPAQVREIKQSTLSGLEFARKFNVSPQNVYAIRRGLSWKHI